MAKKLKRPATRRAKPSKATKATRKPSPWSSDVARVMRGGGRA
jgi:hypothetical protein